MLTCRYIDVENEEEAKGILQDVGHINVVNNAEIDFQLEVRNLDCL